MDDRTSLASITGSRSRKGWAVRVEVDRQVGVLCTPEERAALLEKIACRASAEAATIRQNISASQPED